MSEPNDAISGQEVPGDVESRQQDPRVGKFRPDPSRPAPPVRTLRGFWGDSDRPGFRRLYFSASLDSYAEFQVTDVVEAVDIPPEQAPFPDERATRVTLPRDAQVEITHTRRAGAIDPFDLDIRFGYPKVSAELPVNSVLEPCLLGATPGDVLCDGSQTCGTCYGQNTCYPNGTCAVYSCVDCPEALGRLTPVAPCR
jgi:hypothetical protein